MACVGTARQVAVAVLALSDMSRFLFPDLSSSFTSAKPTSGRHDMPPCLLAGWTVPSPSRRCRCVGAGSP
jgi:hypothetical protein